MTKQAKRHGRVSLHPYTIGAITAIINDPRYSVDEKVNNVCLALKAVEKTFSDNSLPMYHPDVKKASASTESPRENSHPYCTIDARKVESLLDPAYLREILKQEG